MASPAPKPYRHNWIDLLPEVALNRNKGEVIDPNEKAKEAYRTLYQYLDERGELDVNPKTKRQSKRRGRNERWTDWVEGTPFRFESAKKERLDTLLKEAVESKGKIKEVSPVDIFDQNRKFKKPLTSVY